MVYTLNFLENSTRDYKEGLDYYNKISNTLADKFQVYFKNTILEIKNNPLLFQIRYKNIRVANLKNFPFSIHYFIENDIIFVLKILHQKRYYK
ncbi:type II toxin-antitoxin system RelE/ParE family toxin [Polaribacter sp. L3A8]|uniref:type II toxin-antitoxin system RelE/ParE family toxin n=1 Tax=Polaribacter sp. L3A8 TaxID=2686361 RepID=UPI00131B8C59